MRLSELNPRLDGTVSNGTLIHDCPVCRTHSVVTPISDQSYHEESYPQKLFWPGGAERMKKIWQATGTFPDTLTLAPSIDLIEADENGNKVRTRCWHGHIQNGEVS